MKVQLSCSTNLDITRQNLCCRKMPPNPKAPGGEMEVDRAGQPSGDGLRSYYITKIEELLLTVNDKRQNVRRQGGMETL